MQELVVLSKALSDINRLKIVALIQREKELCVCELSDTLALAQPLISRHLKQLKAAKILNSKKAGKWTIYTLTSNPSTLLSTYLKTLQQSQETLNSIKKCDAR